MYWKEYTGQKNNTVRRVDMDDIRFQALKNINIKNNNHIIKIINTKTEENFERQIKDVTFWEGLCIITWRN